MRNRSTDILYYIMNNHKIAYNVDKLSKKYNVTLKTLQNDIKEINQLLKSLGFSNIEYNEDGNLIIAEDFDVVKIKEYLDEMDFYTYKFSKEERRIFIIFMLIRDENFITMSDIADKFYVSRVTILNDIEVIKEILTKYNIVLQSKRSKGIKLLCNEENLRYMMIDLLRKIVKNITGEGYFQRIILTQLNTKYSVSDVVDLLKKFVKKYKYTYTDYVFYENVIYVYVMINRIDKGCNNVYTNENDSSLSIYTDAFINYLEQEINISINKNEKIIYENYIKENDIVPVLEEIGNTDLFSVLLEFLSSIENNLNIELVSDSILVDSLVQHINSMKDWSEKDLDIDFRVTGSMKREFEEVYKEVEKYAYILENHLRHDLNKQRKESIVVHICASLIRSRTDLSPLDILIVCPGSMATGKLIEAQIRNYYDFNIKGVIAADKLFTEWDFNNDNVDFIISTVNIQNDRYPKVITVNPLLSIEDLNRIQQVAFSIQRTPSRTIAKNKKVLMKKIEGILKNIQTEEELIDIKNKLASVIVEDNSLKSLLSKDHIRITKDHLNWEESMIMSGEILVQEKIIYEEYLKKAVSNVKEWGPYIILTKGIALVHASKEQGVNDEAISLLVSSKGVMFEGETEPVYLLFCFCTEGEIDYMDLFKELIALGKNEDKKLKIINSNTIDEVYEAIFS